MEKILIDWIRKNPAFAEDSNDSYHNREQMMKFAKHYHKKQLKLYNVVKRSEPLKCDKVCDWQSYGYAGNGHQECKSCGKQKAF